MGTKQTCLDCQLLKSECICPDRCDYCTNIEDECTCGRDRDPYGHKVFDYKQWLREMENDKGDHEYKQDSV